TDTLENLDLDAIYPQLHAVRVLMRQAWQDSRFKGPVEGKWMRNSFEGQVVSAAPGRPVPDLPRPGFLVTYYYASGGGSIPTPLQLPYTLGIRRNEVAPCDAEGRYWFEGLPRLHWMMQTLAVQVYRVQEGTGAITAVRSEEHTSELQSRENLVCRLLLEKKNQKERGR